jgi:2-dehydro-3-deoxygluconokinase
VPDVVALGEPLLEFVADEPGPLGSVETFRRGWGGDTSNLAIACVRLGASSGYLTRLGDDEFGRSFLSRWEEDGVDSSAVELDQEAHTGFYFVTFGDDGKHDFTYFRAGSAAARMTPGELDLGYVRSARILHVSGISQAISPSAAEAVAEAAAAARAVKVRVSYDANVRPKLAPAERFRALFEQTVPLADVVFLSDEDVDHVFGGDPEQALEEVLRAGPKLAVLKRGAGGALVGSAAGERVAVPAVRVPLVDATGAGDVFAGAFLVEHLRGEGLERAGRFATAAAALAVTGRGAVKPIPRREQVEALTARGAREAAVDHD